METIFLGCLLFGALFSTVSFALGHVGHHGHGHLGQGDHAYGYHTPDDRSPLALLNLPALLAFLTWFGAAGYLLLRAGVWLAIALPVALVAGSATATLIVRLLARVQAGETEMNPADYRLPGTIGHVTVAIPSGGVGEIVFAKAGSRRSEAARAADGGSIARGAEVVITAYEHGIAAVQRWDEFYHGKEGI